METQQFLTELTLVSRPVLALAERVPLEVAVLLPFLASVLLMLFGCFARLRPIK